MKRKVVGKKSSRRHRKAARRLDKFTNGSEAPPKPLNIVAKAAAAKAAPCVAALVSRHVTVDMIERCSGMKIASSADRLEYVFKASGLIIECQAAIDDTYYLCTILTPANIFQRTHDVQPCDIQVDVFLSDGKLYKGEVLVCDFHYNLAAVRIKSDSPLQTATLRALDDILSIDPAEQLKISEKKSFLLRPHSMSFKILPGTEVIALGRYCKHPYAIKAASGVFCAQRPSGVNRARPYLTPPAYTCNELYQIQDIRGNVNVGPVINYSGEVIGIIFNDFSFLPSNIVSRWWGHHKSSGKFYRPFLGMEVANLHEADLDFLEQLVEQFPNVSTGVVVTKVLEDSPAYRSGIRPKDVIVKINGNLVQSNLKFFEKIWDTDAESVKFNVLKVTNGDQLNLSMTIGEVTTDKFNQWPYANYAIWS